MRRSRQASAAIALVLSGVACAPAQAPVTTPPAVPSTPPPPSPPPVVESEPEAVGALHTVEPGQTLWRIARAYGVTVEQIAMANGISDPALLRAGTTIFVPGVDRPLHVPAFPAPPPAPPPAGLPAPPTATAARPGLLWPVADGVILSYFGARRSHHFHAGLDIRGARGQQVIAAQGGSVVFSGLGGGYGRMVVVDHGTGMRTLYAHNEENLVRVGDVVVRGQPIALVGRSGNATAEHCHFEVRVDDRPVDPIPYFSGIVEARR